ARAAATAETREAIWVDPVSLPRTTDGTASTATGVPAHMPQDPGTGTAPVAPGPAPRPFKLG
ncbi:hypothetical protein HO151_03335, partial [Streptomyces sp. 8P21H-1]|nr:hypothetical protein [Streptomyces sp. 8P21H-1]